VLALSPALALAQDPDHEPYAYAEDEEERRPFEQGELELGLGFGYVSGGGGSAYLLRGAFSYYVLPGLAPGLDVTYQGGDYPGADQTWLLVPVKWVLYRSYDVSPYVIGQGGRIFLHDEGFDDLWIVGGGPGVYLFSSRRLGFFVQGIYYRLYPSDACADCSAFQVGLGLSFLL